VEHFRDSCGGVIGWLDSVTYYTAFTEGWALYAENPLIAQDTDTYKTEPMQKFGMLKWQVNTASFFPSQFSVIVSNTNPYTKINSGTDGQQSPISTMQLLIYLCLQDVNHREMHSYTEHIQPQLEEHSMQQGISLKASCY